MDPLTVIGLVKYVPDLIGLFDKRRGEQAQQIAETVGKVAEQVTGKKGSAAVSAIESSPQLAYEFQTAVMADRQVRMQIEAQEMQSARDAYKINPRQADTIAEHIMRYNLLLMAALVVVNVVAVHYLKSDAAVLAIVSNFIGIALNALINERQAVTGFYFGSSIGSKLKDKPQGG